VKLRKVAVIGLGLIGGSLARALKGSGGVGEVAGADTDAGTLDYALREGVVDTCTADIAVAAAGSELVVIATHVGLIPKIASDIVPHLSQSAVLTDVGSVKGEIVRRITPMLPPGVRFVGGHPIAGTERSGVISSDAALFSGRTIVLTPTADTPKEALGSVTSMWELTGAKVIEMDPARHDRIFAFVSHMPHAVAYSLVAAVINQRDPAGIYDFAGGGLNDFTRIAATSPEMWKDIFLMNRDDVLVSLAEFSSALRRLERLIELRDEEGLLRELERAAAAKRKGK